MIKISKAWRAMGTTNQITLFGTDDERYLDDAIRFVNHYEDLLTVNRPVSAVMAINHAAGQSPVVVPPAVYQLVKRAVAVSNQHFGFNAAIGPLVKLWHIGFADARVPSDIEIGQRRELIGSDEIVLDDERLSVYLPHAGMELDLGAIAKGYIADRLQDYLRSQGHMAAIINFGGNIVLMNEAPHKADGRWRIGVRDPLVRHGKTIGLLTTPATSVVTSGVAERHLSQTGRLITISLIQKQVIHMIMSWLVSRLFHLNQLMVKSRQPGCSSMMAQSMASTRLVQFLFIVINPFSWLTFDRMILK